MKLPDTYSSFLRSIQSYSITDVDELLAATSSIGSIANQFFNKFMPACYIIDYTRREYVYATPRVTSFIDEPVSRFLDGGLEFTTKLFHKEDLKVYSEKVLHENLKFLKGIPPEKHQEYLFHCNYRVRKADGGYRNIIQESVFVRSTNKGMPMAAIGVLYDITAYRNDDKMIHKIMHLNPQADPYDPGTVVVSNVFFSSERRVMISEREIEVLKYICDDLSSEEIAKKLFISKHTVDNHRRNLLEKTNIKSSIGLVRFAMENGYL